MARAGLLVVLMGVVATGADGFVARDGGTLVTPVVGRERVGVAVLSSRVEFETVTYNNRAASANALIRISAVLARRCTISPQLRRM